MILLLLCQKRFWYMCYFVGGRMSMEVTKKQCTPNFPENKYFLLPDNAHTCACGGVTNFRFSENFRALFPCYLRFWHTPFRLITDDLSQWLCLLMWRFTQLSHFMFSSILQHFYTPWKCQGRRNVFRGCRNVAENWETVT